MRFCQNNNLKSVYLQLKSHSIPKSESTWDFYAIVEFEKPVSVLNYDYSWIYVNPQLFTIRNESLMGFESH